MNLKICVISLILLLGTSKSYSQNKLEIQIEELIKNNVVVNFFKDQEVTVILSNQNCNVEICNPEKISSYKDLKIFEFEEAYIRNLVAISIIEIVEINSEITRFKIKTTRRSYFNVDIKTP